jgi:CRP/FNR family transcriptional regulator
MLKDRHNLGIHCGTCSASHLCIPRNLSTEEINQVDQLITRVQIVDPGEHLYHLNSKMDYLFAVFSGCCKDYLINNDGKEYINNFYFPGDILGLESIPNKKYLYYAVALKPSKLCAIPINALLDKTIEQKKLMHRIMHIMSYKMQNDKHVRLTTNANQRIADFLINMLNRASERNIPSDSLKLPMSQFDISYFLGLAYETVSRTLHGLEKNKIIKICNKEICIIDVIALKKLATITNASYGQIEPN